VRARDKERDRNSVAPHISIRGLDQGSAGPLQDHLCVCVYACVRVRESQRQREREREREGERE